MAVDPQGHGQVCDGDWDQRGLTWQKNPESMVPPGFEDFEFDVSADAAPSRTVFDRFPLKHGDVISFGGKHQWVVINAFGSYTIAVARPTDDAKTRLRFEAHIVDHDGNIEVWSVGYTDTPHGRDWGRNNDKVYDTGHIRDLVVLEHA